MNLTERQKGIAFALLGSLIYALKSVGVKCAPPARIEFFVFVRFVFDFLLLLPFFILHRNKLRSKQPLLHGVRAIFVVIAITCSVYGMRHLALVDATLLEMTLPLFVPLVAWIWQGKKIKISSFFLLVLGFTSIFMLVKPKLDIFHLASFASVGTGLCTAITSVSINKLSTTDHPLALLFYYYVFSAVLTLIPFAATWENYPQMATVSFWLPFVFISLCGVLFQYTMIKAYSLNPPHIAGNFVYFGILFNAFFGWLIWEETLSVMQILGGVLLIGSGMLIVKNQRDSSDKTQALSKESPS